MINIPKPNKGQNQFNKPPTWPAPPGFNPLIPGHLIDPTWPDPGPDWQYWTTTKPRNGSIISALWVLTLILLFGITPTIIPIGLGIMRTITTYGNFNNPALTTNYNPYQTATNQFAAAYLAYSKDINNIDPNTPPEQRIQLDLQYAKELQGQYKAWEAIEKQTKFPPKTLKGIPDQKTVNAFSKANGDFLNYIITTFTAIINCGNENPINKTSPDCITALATNSPAGQNKTTTIEQALQTADQNFDLETGQTMTYTPQPTS